ncbi:MAG: TIGR02281 family clan AA aspartic protease [Rhodobacteraceae bacterium]|nr:TIGR02281 family clan AA aspartic protease [Paracoccaceae bacterium]
MSEDQTARLVYLSLILLVIGGAYVLSHRRRIGQMLRHAAIWGLIFIGALAAVGLWQDIRRDVLPRQSMLADGRIEVPAAADGHFYLMAEVNGAPVRFVVDTGATHVVLTRADAARAGIDPDGLAYLGQARTANGIVRTAQVRLDSLSLGPVQMADLRAVVNDGEMDVSLLGMSLLNRFEAVELRRDRLVLTP